MKNNTKRLATLAITISFAMILSYLESRMPAFVAIPGIKVGLANIAVIFTLYKLGIKEAVAVSIVRVILLSILFGNIVAMVYSIVGATLSLASMVLLKKFTPLSAVSVSVCGGVMHNVGQILTAALMLDTGAVLYYLPFLLLSGSMAGIVVGVAAALLINRIQLEKI